MNSDMNHKVNGNPAGTTDDLSDQLDRALRPGQIAMPREFEAQAAALGEHRVQHAATQPIVLRMNSSRSAAWRWATHPLALAAGVLVAAGLFWGGRVFFGHRDIPDVLIVRPDPNRQWSSDLWDRGDSLGELRHNYSDPAAELWLGREVYAVSADVVHDDIPRAFDAPRRGISLSDSARQLGLE